MERNETLNERHEWFMVGLLQGMKSKSCQFFNDEDADYRNGAWYARKMYGERYEQIEDLYQRAKMNEIEREIEDERLK